VDSFGVVVQVGIKALERGPEDLWENLVLAQHLDGELDREAAVKPVDRTKSNASNGRKRSSRRTSTGTRTHDARCYF
jgi:hypothetical protein